MNCDSQKHYILDMARKKGNVELKNKAKKQAFTYNIGNVSTLWDLKNNSTTKFYKQ